MLNHFNNILIKGKKMKKTILSLVASSVLVTGVMAKTEVKSDTSTVLQAYANIASTNYTDALNDAVKLQEAVKSFTAAPTEQTLEAAKKSWLDSRESYGQTEIFRLANGPIDAEEGWVADTYGGLEGQLNAWPLDENMIDYTINAKGEKTSGNIIDTKGTFNPGGEESKAVDVTTITAAAITELNENGGDANVATGYHAIEFLLWGQDQDYSNFVKDGVTNGATTAGQRPLTDYTTEANADRRKAYLNSAAAKIVADLKVVNSAWEKSISSDCTKDATGCYRGALLSTLTGADANKNIAKEEALKTILAGMGVFIKSEVANERIAVAVLTPSEEDEHSCFSDNTHRDIVANYQGFKNVLTGAYNGKSYGASMMDAMDEKSKAEMTELMGKIEMKIEKVNTLATSTEHFDYQIHPENKNAKTIVKLKNEMRKLGDNMVAVATANGLTLSIDDVTDPEETKF